MPTKFRRNVWLRRGLYVLVEPILIGTKAKGEVVKIFTKKAIQFYKYNSIWPKEFEENEILDIEKGKINLSEDDFWDDIYHNYSDCSEDDF